MPEPITSVSAGASITPIWVNGLGGLTFQLGAGPNRRFAEWAPAGSGIDLVAERVRLEWAGRYAAVPVVLDHSSDRDGSWLPTPPLIDRLVVCHGEACTPNTLIDVDGRCSGHVDLSSLGTADR